MSVYAHLCVEGIFYVGTTKRRFHSLYPPLSRDMYMFTSELGLIPWKRPDDEGPEFSQLEISDVVEVCINSFSILNKYIVRRV